MKSAPSPISCGSNWKPCNERHKTFSIPHLILNASAVVQAVMAPSPVHVLVLHFRPNGSRCANPRSQTEDN